jgi:hypothetical protein
MEQLTKYVFKNAYAAAILALLKGGVTNAIEIDNCRLY